MASSSSDSEYTHRNMMTCMPSQHAGLPAAAEAGAVGSSSSAMEVDGASPNTKAAKKGRGAAKPQYKLDLGPEDGRMEVVSPLKDGLGAFVVRSLGGNGQGGREQ